MGDLKPVHAHVQEHTWESNSSDMLGSGTCMNYTRQADFHILWKKTTSRGHMQRNETKPPINGLCLALQRFHPAHTFKPIFTAIRVRNFEQMKAESQRG